MSATQHIQHRPFTWGLFFFDSFTRFSFLYFVFLFPCCFWFGSVGMPSYLLAIRFYLAFTRVTVIYNRTHWRIKMYILQWKKNRKSSHIFTFKHIHKTYSFTFLCIHLLMMQVIICYFSSFSFLFRESQRKLKSGQNNVDSKMLLRIKKNAKREMENRKRKEKSEKLRNLTMVKRLSTSNKFMCMHTHTFSFIYFYKCMCMLSVFFYFELAHYVFVVGVTIQYIKIPFDRRMDRTNLKINMLRKVAFSWKCTNYSVNQHNIIIC